MHDGKEPHMNYRQRQRYLKAGGIVAFILLLIFFFSPGDSGLVEKYVGGKEGIIPFVM
jgi:hypothetical protein